MGGVLNVPGGIVFLGLAAMVTGGAVLLWYEGLALVTGVVPPITWMVDRVTQRHLYGVVVIVAVLMFAIGLLTGHFWGNQPPDWIYRIPGVTRR